MNDHEEFVRVYDPAVIDDVEDREEYRAEGFHLIHIGDKLGGRYRIIYKLGSGGFSTVQLAQDEKAESTHNIALKVIAVERSAQDTEIRLFSMLCDNSTIHPGKNSVCPLLNSFRFDGPNGNHLCLVMEVVGPSIAALMLKPKADGWFSPPTARKITLQVAQALDYLHSRGVGHGDFTAGNALIEVDDIATLSQPKIYARFGAP